MRGCCTVEQSVLGGTAHLLNFDGSDTLSAAYYAQVGRLLASCSFQGAALSSLYSAVQLFLGSQIRLEEPAGSIRRSCNDLMALLCCMQTV